MDSKQWHRLLGCGLLCTLSLIGLSCDASPVAAPPTVVPQVVAEPAPSTPATEEPPAKAPAPKAADESWQVIYIGASRVGYVHSTSQDITRDGRKLERSTSDTHMTLKRGGQELSMQILLETVATPDGELVSFTQETRNPPAASSKLTGVVKDDKLLLTTTVAGQSTEKEMPWDKNLKAPSYEAKLLSENPLKPGESRSFEIFVPEVRQKAKVTLTAGDMEEVELFGGETRKLLKMKSTNSVMPIATDGWVDDEGQTLKSQTNMLGLVMTTYEVSQEEALKAIAGGELDLLVGTLVKVDPIPQGHRSRKVVYEITTPGENPAEFFVADETQSIKQISDETIRLTVAPPKPPEKAETGDAKPEYLASTEFLQCIDERVVEHANKAAGDETDPAAIARSMESYVSKTLKNKNFSTAMASAAEVAENLEGDCTEHAVLLAAMLRAKKIPSRIAVGLVYIEGQHQFGGHMWSEAQLGGKWIPLDATLGRGGIGGAHIKMANSSFADDGPAPVLSFLPMMKVLGKMKIEVVESE